MLCLPHGVNLSLCKGAHLRISDFIGAWRNHTAMQVSSCALQPFEFATDFFFLFYPQCGEREHNQLILQTNHQLTLEWMIHTRYIHGELRKTGFEKISFLHKPRRNDHKVLIKQSFLRLYVHACSWPHIGEPYQPQAKVSYSGPASSLLLQMDVPKSPPSPPPA